MLSELLKPCKSILSGLPALTVSDSPLRMMFQMDGPCRSPAAAVGHLNNPPRQWLHCDCASVNERARARLTVRVFATTAPERPPAPRPPRPPCPPRASERCPVPVQSSGPPALLMPAALQPCQLAVMLPHYEVQSQADADGHAHALQRAHTSARQELHRQAGAMTILTFSISVSDNRPSSEPRPAAASLEAWIRTCG
jgi:hypothetical protein